ncbi:MAG: hypothetical protein ABFD25_12310 [Clostridiaceae bacterium]
MKKFDYLNRGKCRMLSDTLNWALYGDIADIDLCLNSGFNAYYGDLYGSGEETFPKHMAHRSIEYQKQNIEANREHISRIKGKGIAYIYYSSSCTFDSTFFDSNTIQKFNCIFKKPEIAFNTPNRKYACFNSPEWLQFQIDKTVMLAEELDVDGVFFDNIFFLNPCQCDNCVKKYKSELNKDLKTAMQVVEMQDTDEKVHNKGSQTAGGFSQYSDDKTELYRNLMEYYDWRLKCLVEFFTRYRQGVDSRIKKDFAIISNGFLNVSETMDMYRSGIFDCYYSENGYSFPPETNVFTHKVGNAINRENGETAAPVAVTRVLEGMPTPGMMKSFIAEGAANGGCSTPWGFFIHESSELKQAVVSYERFLEKHEKLYARQNNLAEVAVVMPIRASALKKLLGDEQGYMKNSSSIVSRMLNDLHIPHDVLFAEETFNCELLDKYKMLVFPEVDILSNDNFDSIKRYAAKGGTVLATGDSFTFDEILVKRRIDLNGEKVFIVKDKINQGYLNKRLTCDYGVIMKDFIAEMIADINPSDMLKTNAGPLTAIVLTRSDSEMLVHCVNYNTNRGPYSIRVIPEYKVDIEVKADCDIKSVLCFSPDGSDVKKPLEFLRNGNKIKFQLPKLEYYSIIELDFI